MSVLGKKPVVQAVSNWSFGSIVLQSRFRVATQDIGLMQPGEFRHNLLGRNFYITGFIE